MKNPEQTQIAISLSVEQWKAILDWSKTEKEACGLNESEAILTKKIKDELKSWGADVSVY